jgi:hypothetical protein
MASALRCAIAEVKQRWSVIGWVIKKLLFQAHPCFGRLVKPMVPAAFAVVSTHPYWARVVGYGPFSICIIHKEGLCPRSGDINRLMMRIGSDILHDDTNINKQDVGASWKIIRTCSSYLHLYLEYSLRSTNKIFIANSFSV